MASFIIAFDTSHNKTYSCVVFGFQNDIIDMYKNISIILAKYGKMGTFHWQRISNKIRKSAKNEIYEIINNSPVSFYIFKHQKPRLIDKNKYFLFSVPNFISSFLEKRLRGKFGLVKIEADDDYLIANVNNSSLKFVENFMNQICFRLIGTFVKIMKDGKLRATIKHPNGNIMNFIGYVTNRSFSEGIQLSDLILGYYFYDNRGLNKIEFIELK